MFPLMDSTLVALNWPLSTTRQTMKRANQAKMSWAVLWVVEEIESPIYVCMSLCPLILPSAIEDNNIAGIKNTTGHPATSANVAPKIVENGGFLTVAAMPHRGYLNTWIRTRRPLKKMGPHLEKASAGKSSQKDFHIQTHFPLWA